VTEEPERQCPPSSSDDDPPDFRIMPPRTDDRKGTVRVLFDPETIRWARESRSFFQIAEENRRDGLLVTLKLRHDEEIVSWLLSWGSHVRVLESASGHF